MKIVFFSTFISPHLKPFCDYLYMHTQGGFLYVQTMPLSAERKALGYSYNKNQIPYIMNLTDNFEEQIQIANDADCVIINTGSANPKLVFDRIRANKLTFFCNERLFKRGLIKLADLRLWQQWRLNLLARKKKTYLLCIGSYVAEDFEKIGFEKGKSYKFGYFPEVHINSGVPNKDSFKILWVGRMIDWKRPFLAIKIAELLAKRAGFEFEINLIGDGVLMSVIRRIVQKSSCSHKIHLLGLIPNLAVREYMKSSNVLLITSNRREGWGAVANEALSSGIPVVAFHTIGSASYLLKDGYNAYLCDDNNIEQAVDAIKSIKDNTSVPFNQNIINTMNLWNAPIAGARFLQIFNKIQSGIYIPDLFKEGPLSKS